MHLNYIASSVLLFTSVVSASAAEVRVDPPHANSILLENFSSASDPTTEVRNGVRFDSASAGVGKYTISAVLDPQMFFHGYTGGIDFSSYPNFRIRHSFSKPTKGGSIYPLPVRAGAMRKILVNNSLTGRQVTLTRYPAKGEGLRLDPVDGAPLAGEYLIDYIILDRGRTLGFEFDQKNSTRGGVNNFFISHNLAGQDNGKEISSAVNDGVFRGSPTNSDPMMVLQMGVSNGLASIEPEVYKFIEVRMRVLEPRQGVATLFFRNEPGGLGASKIELYLVDDKFFHTYLIDMSDDVSWNEGLITSFRFDPTNKKQVFEIDHIRFYETAKLD